MTNPEMMNCHECGAEIVRTVYNRKYCTECLPIVQARHAMENYRKAQFSVMCQKCGGTFLSKHRKTKHCPACRYERRCELLAKGRATQTARAKRVAPKPPQKGAVPNKALTRAQFAWMRGLLDGKAAAPGPAGHGDVVRRRVSGGHY